MITTLKGLEPAIADILKCGGIHSIPRANAEELLKFSQESGDKEVLAVQYQSGSCVVEEGKIIEKNLGGGWEYGYSQVPLGFITQGTLTVFKGGKATKTLGPGDFIGLFETSDWLLTKHNRQIGDWKLTAQEATTVLFFGRSMLKGENVKTAQFVNYLTSIARKDPAPQPNSSLSLLDWVASHTTRSRLSNCAIVVHTHLLPNNTPFFRHLSHLVAPGRIFILEKPYSTVRGAFTELVSSGYDVTRVHVEDGVPYEFAVHKSIDVLWRKVVERQKNDGFTKIIVVDDGGDLWHSIPWNDLAHVQIAGVEQTQRGIARTEESTVRIPPIVSVASSGIKKILESEFIGISVVKKLKELHALSETTSIGIVGMGSIGSAVGKALGTLGYTARAYDPACPAQMPSNIIPVASLDLLLKESDLIIGTAGMDSLQGTAFERVSGKKVLVSASSADIEFHSLLKLAEPTNDIFGPREVQVHEDLSFKILNGGYPVNFDRVKDSTPDEDIVLTRCLLYIGAMQAAYLLNIPESVPGIYDLDRLSQKHLLEEWTRYKSDINEPVSLPLPEQARIVEYRALKAPLKTPTVWRS